VRRDRIEKRIVYARAGVRESWVVDPERHEIAVYGTLGDRFDEPRRFASGAIASHVLSGLRVTVAQILAAPS
jgi:Uma2 family endonuclease